MVNVKNHDRISHFTVTNCSYIRVIITEVKCNEKFKSYSHHHTNMKYNNAPLNTQGSEKRDTFSVCSFILVKQFFAFLR